MKQLKITKFPELDYAGSEAFNTLSTNLSFAGETVKKIMITSCHASEGKSYLSMNLMRTLAQRGMKVALVDADLRRSVVNAQYGLQFEDGRNDDKGLSHFLAGMVGMEEVIYQTDIPGALMVPVGRDVPNPLALLSNHHFKDLLDALAQRVDYVLVDAAPVGVVIDAAEIAKSCDGTLIAVQYNDVRRQELLDVKQQIEQSGCPILGTVLNQVDYDSYLSRKYYYRTYGKYGYYNRYYNGPAADHRQRLPGAAGAHRALPPPCPQRRTAPPEGAVRHPLSGQCGHGAGGRVLPAAAAGSLAEGGHRGCHLLGRT